MLTIPVYNSQGKELESLSLPKNIFGLKVSPTLLHLVSTVFLGNVRKGTAKVKTRAERRGGGRKPYKQKGTSNARSGTIRSPIWRKGGRVFGPTGEQNYHRELPHKVKVKALLMGLSAKAQSKHIVALQNVEMKAVSTKEFATVLKTLPVDRSVLFVLPAKDEKLILSARNIPTVTTRTYDNINTLDVLTHDYIVLLSETLPLMEKKWGEYSFKGILSDEELKASLEKNANLKEKSTEKKLTSKKVKVAEKTSSKAKTTTKKASKPKATKSSKA